jgi:hypothetical protein
MDSAEPYGGAGVKRQEVGMARVRVHDELRVRELRGQEKGVDRHHDDVLVAVHDQRRLMILLSMAKRFSEGMAPHSRMDSS